MTGLTATAVSATQINLSWTAATDNVGVTGYRVERCQGAGCTSFVQIATPAGTTFSDTGLTASTSYSYRVKAVDAATNVSVNYSTVASATTPAPPDTTPPSDVTGLTATAAAPDRSISAGPPPPTTSASPAIASSAVRGRAAPPSSQIATPTGDQLQRYGPHRRHQLQLSREGRRCRHQSERELLHRRQCHHPSAPPDTTPPTDPTGLTATRGRPPRSISSWTAATDNVGVDRLSRRALSGGGLHHLCPDRHAHHATVSVIPASRPAPATAIESGRSTPPAI